MKLLKVSCSTLKNVAKCSTLTALKRSGYSGKEPGWPLIAGKCAHTALEYWFTPGQVPIWKDGVRLFKQEYEKYTSEYGQPEVMSKKWARLSEENLIIIMEEWFRTHPLDKLPFTPEKTEIDFEYPLGDKCVACGHKQKAHIESKNEGSIVPCCECFCGCGEYIQLVIIGVIDLLARVYSNENPDGALYLIEHKTTGRIDQDWMDDFNCDPQNTIYQMVAEKIIGERVIGSYINGIQFSLLPSDPKRTCSDHHSKYSECGRFHNNDKHKLFLVQREEDETESIIKDVISLGREYYKIITQYGSLEGATKTRTKGKFNGACMFCEFKQWCRWHTRAIHLAEQDMGHFEESDRHSARSGLYEAA